MRYKMFDISKFPPIINHLRSLSTYYKDRNNEIVIFCSYCDDSTRVKATHGHLNISKNHPVWYCFRCGSSGTLTRLLIDTGFDDQEILNDLSQFVKYRAVKDYHKIKQHIPKITQIKTRLIENILLFENKFPDKFKIFDNYLKMRLGYVKYDDFLISPTMINGKVNCLFTNALNEDVLIRFIENSGDIRYQINQIGRAHV